MTDEDHVARARRYTFAPAPEGSTTDERIAVALEFIARQAGDAANSLDHLNEQMTSLITSVDWLTLPAPRAMPTADEDTP